MTTMDTMPSIRQFALMKVSSLAQNRAKKATEGTYRVNAVLNTLIRLMLHLAGFGLLTLAGFQWNMIAGLIVAGLSCFALSTLMTNSSKAEKVEVRRAPDLRTGR